MEKTLTKGRRAILLKWFEEIGAFPKLLDDGSIFFNLGTINNVYISDSSDWILLCDMRWYSFDENDNEQLRRLIDIANEMNNEFGSRIVFERHKEGLISVSTYMDVIFTLEDSQLLSTFVLLLDNLRHVRYHVRKSMGLNTDDCDYDEDHDYCHCKSGNYSIPMIIYDKLTELGYECNVIHNSDIASFVITGLERPVQIDALETSNYPKITISEIHEFAKNSPEAEEIYRIINDLNHIRPCTFAYYEKDNGKCDVRCLFKTSVFPNSKIDNEITLKAGIELVLDRVKQFYDMMTDIQNKKS